MESPTPEVSEVLVGAKDAQSEAPVTSPYALHKAQRQPTISSDDAVSKLIDQISQPCQVAR